MITSVKGRKLETREKVMISIFIISFLVLCVLSVVCPAYANEYQSTIKSVLNSMIGIVGTIFQAVGVILSIYAVGQLILAFKNEDANSKSSASTLLVVGIALIAVPGIIKGLNLVNYIGQ